jgi:hypothetical protein
MSDRRRPTSNTAGRDYLRALEDRVRRLETHIGNGAVEIVVAKTGEDGEGRTITWRNTASGSESVIDLP